MSVLSPAKLHRKFIQPTGPEGPLTPRRYTLTHSDLTGDLYLVIGPDYDHRAISGVYTRLMRDEVLAEWIISDQDPNLHVYCHVSGGIIFGSASWRDGILRYHMPQVLQAFRYGDQQIFKTSPDLEKSSVYIHFRASQPRYNRVENWGNLIKYRIMD